MPLPLYEKRSSRSFLFLLSFEKKNIFTSEKPNGFRAYPSASLTLRFRLRSISAENKMTIDLVTMLKRQEGNQLYRRGCTIEGWNMLNAGNPTILSGEGADAQGVSFREGIKADYELKNTKSGSNAMAVMLGNILSDIGYQAHPEIDFMVRSFQYDKDQATFVLDPITTLRALGLRYSETRKAEIETFLIAEMELGDNPRILAKLAEQFPTYQTQLETRLKKNE